MGEPCGCFACIGDKPAYEGARLTVGMTRMIVCAVCGNKRCPHSTDHRLPCTGSNEPGQPGSRYGGIAVAAAADINLPDLHSRNPLSEPVGEIPSSPDG